MAGPSGAILQSTRRGARYWALKGHIQNAVSAAYRKEVSPSEAAATDPDAFGILQVSQIPFRAVGENGIQNMSIAKSPYRLYLVINLMNTLGLYLYFGVANLAFKNCNISYVCRI